VDPQGFVALVNKRATQFLGLMPSDQGRPFRDLELSYRPVELRSVIERAQTNNSPVALEDVERVLPSGQTRVFDIEVTPLTSVGGGKVGTQLAFVDVTARQLVRRELQQARHEVETAHEELQSTNEELETSNEELQSTVEELQTTNEELQSTNEEMETVNEELQSTNDELQAVNKELRQQTLEADRASIFLESILASVDVAVVVIDRDYHILLWNERAEDMWGLRTDETRGRSLLHLDTGLPVERFVEPLQRLWADPRGGTQEIVLEALTRRGRRVRIQVTISARKTDDPLIQGAVLLMEEQEDI
jgi:two-component system, chemotaxis family, CheB/CheR fusion protein